MGTVRFQVLCLPTVPWPELRDRFIRLEALGLESAALPDHFVDWTNPSSPWFESWTALTGLAAATTRLRIATCVTQIPLRNPAMFARQALTLDHVSNGRLEIGLGTGLVGDRSYQMIGPWPSLSEPSACGRGGWPSWALHRPNSRGPSPSKFVSDSSNPYSVIRGASPTSRWPPRCHLPKWPAA